MMINFTGKIIADKSLFRYKSNGKEIFKQAEQIMNTPVISFLLKDDEITLSRNASKNIDKITIKCNQKEEIEIVMPQEEVPPSAVVRQILFYACYKNGKTPRSMTTKNLITTIKQIITEKGAN